MASFILVPLTLNYLDTYKYGIWITLSSIISWFNFFDIGLGNGLRNKFAEALAIKDIILARIYLSTTYALLILIISPIYVIFLIVNHFLNWSTILNAPPSMAGELNLLVILAITAFGIQFILQPVRIILFADQKPAIVDLINLIVNLISLIVIYILTKTSQSSLLSFGLSFSIIPVIVYIALSIYIYLTYFKKYKPSLKLINLNYIKNLTSIGIQFFILQVSGVALYSASNIIITQFSGPSEVTSYNIAYKYFTLIIMIFSIILSPFWTGFTDAYIKNDMDWIKSTMKKLYHISLGLIFIVALMIIFSKTFYKMWIGDTINISFKLSFTMGIYVILFLLSSPFLQFLNGISKIRLQMYISVFGVIIYFPLSILLIKYLNFGNLSVILPLCFINFLSLVLYFLQYNKIIDRKAIGIWFK